MIASSDDDVGKDDRERLMGVNFIYNLIHLVYTPISRKNCFMEIYYVCM